ncbi:hypothetical protein GCM10009530_13920 [Microbispora corallina]
MVSSRGRLAAIRCAITQRTGLVPMIGGFEYWAREGFAVVTASGGERRPPDPLTAPAAAVSCGC